MKKIVEDSKKVMQRYSDMTYSEMTSMMKDAIEALPTEQQGSAKFEIDEYYYPYDDKAYFALFMKWKRPETDEEETIRVEQETKYKTARIERDRAEFERLKKQFDGN